jgi:hypothetical protein
MKDIKKNKIQVEFISYMQSMSLLFNKKIKIRDAVDMFYKQYKYSSEHISEDKLIKIWYRFRIKNK